MREKGKQIGRIAVPDGESEVFPTIDNPRRVAATDYRLIGLTSGDLPQPGTPMVHLYEVNLEGK